MANSVADELRKAFDHVGLRVDLVHIGYRKATVDTHASPGASDSLEQFSFWVPETYVFQGHNPGQGWRRVEDESPADGDEVLVWTENGAAIALFDEGWSYVGGSQKATHWMPLPAPPSD